jgi:hypothetical protein
MESQHFAYEAGIFGLKMLAREEVLIAKKLENSATGVGVHPPAPTPPKHAIAWEPGIV